MSRLNCIALYWSAGGNTQRVASAATDGLRAAGADVTLLSISDPQAEEVDLGAYHLVFLACPSYHFGAPAPMRRYVEQALRKHDVRPTAPVLPQRWGVALITYAGPHTGIDEATPAGDFLVQGLRHIGRQVRGIWYTVGAFHGDPDQVNNRLGWLGDIRGRPNEHDLGVITANARGLAYVLQHELDQG
ncbi:MAG: flavodoxin domain-containing protein [Anaerolineae bacterium]